MRYEDNLLHKNVQVIGFRTNTVYLKEYGVPDTMLILDNITSLVNKEGPTSLHLILALDC